MVDLAELDRLRKRYQDLSENVGQAWVEGSDLAILTDAEAEANDAGAEWLRAVHRAWPEISDTLALAWLNTPPDPAVDNRRNP